jgi:hypothetical protein
MKKAKNLISEKAAVQLLKRLFADAKSEVMTLDEVYAAAGRAERNSDTNRNWLNGILAKLRHYKLVETIDKYENSRSKLDKLKLTIAGKTAIGWPVDTGADVSSHTPVQRGMTYNDLAKAVAAFRNENSDFDVVFEVKLKEVQPTK